MPNDCDNVPAPWFVALNDNPRAKSISDKFMATGMYIRCRNKLEPNEAVIVPVALRIGPLIPCMSKISVTEIFGGAKLPGNI